MLFPRSSKVSVHGAGEDPEAQEQDEDVIVSVYIPYFGVIKITRLELSKDSPRSRNNSPRGTCVAQPQMIENSSTIITEPLGTKPKMLQPKLGMSYEIQDTDAITPIDRNCNHIETQSITNSLGETQTIHSTGMNTGVLQSEPQPQFDIPSDPYWNVEIILSWQPEEKTGHFRVLI